MNVVWLVLRAGLRDLSRNRWIAAYAASFFVLAEALFWFGGTGAQVTLSLLNIVLIVVPLVSLVFGTIHVYASREFVELLLAQPVRRGVLFAGLYLGLALPLSLAFACGTAVPLLVHGAAGPELGAFLALLGAGVGLSLAFAAIATWVALITDDRLKGVAVALGIWLAATVLYDGAVLAVAAAFADWPLERPLLGLMLANPVDVARVLVIARLDAAALLGYTGALFTRAFGTALGAGIASAALAMWCAVPLYLAARRFRARDF